MTRSPAARCGRDQAPIGEPQTWKDRPRPKQKLGQCTRLLHSARQCAQLAARWPISLQFLQRTGCPLYHNRQGKPRMSREGISLSTTMLTIREPVLDLAEFGQGVADIHFGLLEGMIVDVYIHLRRTGGLDGTLVFPNVKTPPILNHDFYTWMLRKRRESSSRGGSEHCLQHPGLNCQACPVKRWLA